MNNLALSELVSRKFEPARHHLTQAAKHAPRPSEVNQNIGRLIIKVDQLRVPPAVVKQIALLNTNASEFRPQTGWLYMPLDHTDSALTDYKSFCVDGILEDRSCTQCNGKGKLPCFNCKGTGYVLAESTSTSSMQTQIGPTSASTLTTSRVPCRTCGGSKMQDCRDCVDGHDPTLGR